MTGYGLGNFHTSAFAKNISGGQPSIDNFRANNRRAASLGRRVIEYSQLKKATRIADADKDLNEVCTILLGTVCNIASDEMTDAIGTLGAAGLLAGEVRRHVRRAQKVWQDYEVEQKAAMGRRFKLYVDAVDFASEELKQERLFINQAVIRECQKARIGNEQVKGKVIAALCYMQIVEQTWLWLMEEYQKSHNFNFGKYYKIYRLEGMRKAWNKVIELTCNDYIDFDCHNENSPLGRTSKVFINKLYDEKFFNCVQFTAVKMNLSLLTAAERREAFEAAKRIGINWDEI